MGAIINCFKRSPSPTNEEEEPKRKKNTLSPEDKAILDCKQSRDKIKGYIKRLELNETSQRNRAKELLKNKEKDKAKHCLSQSKMYKIQIENAQNQLSAVEDQINRIDMAKTQKDVFNVLENTNKVLTELQKEVNIERLEKIGEDLNDIKANNDEITNFFKNHNVDIDQNEEEINQEIEKLMKLESNQIENEMPDAGKKNVDHLKKPVDSKSEKEKGEILIEA